MTPPAWSRSPPSEVTRLSDAEWTAFVSEVKACNGWSAAASSTLPMSAGMNARFCAGLASHRKYRGLSEVQRRPAAQVFFCIDEREESMRRALEEVDPEVETFSAAGYFGVAVDYKGIDDPHGAAFCPVVVKPEHAVLEQPKAEDSALLESAPSAQAASGIADAEFVRLLEDADARLALDGRARIAFGGSADRPIAGAQALCPAARLDEQGVPARAAHRTDVDAEHCAIARRGDRSADRLRRRRKSGTSGERFGPGRADARLRAHRGHPRATDRPV